MEGSKIGVSVAPPAWALEDPELSYAAKLLLYLLCSYARPDALEIWPSTQELSARLSMSRPSVFRALLALEKKGVISNTGKRKGRGIIVRRISFTRLTDDTPSHIRTRLTDEMESHGRDKGVSYTRLTRLTDDTRKIPGRDQEETKDNIAVQSPSDFELKPPAADAPKRKKRSAGASHYVNEFFAWYSQARQQVGAHLGRRLSPLPPLTPGERRKAQEAFSYLSKATEAEGDEILSRWRLLALRWDFAQALRDHEKLKWCRVRGKSTFSPDGISIKIGLDETAKEGFPHSSIDQLLDFYKKRDIEAKRAEEDLRRKEKEKEEAGSILSFLERERKAERDREIEEMAIDLFGGFD